MCVYLEERGGPVHQVYCDHCGWLSAPTAAPLAEMWAKEHRLRCPDEVIDLTQPPTTQPPTSTPTPTTPAPTSTPTAA
jgi:hypothetical protein